MDGSLLSSAGISRLPFSFKKIFSSWTGLVFLSVSLMILNACSGGASGLSASTPLPTMPPLPPTVNPVPVTVSAGFLKDINTGTSQDVSSNWVKMSGALYFVNNPSSNPGHQIWKSSAAGVGSLVIDLGLENSITSMILDTRTSAVPTRFYFVVNGVQLWTSDGTITTKIAEFGNAGGLTSTSAMGNDLYFQVNGTGNNGQVFKTVNGGAPFEVYSTGTLSYAMTVAFFPAVTHMYIYSLAPSAVVYSHTGTLSAASGVATLTAANTVSQAKIVGDDLYYQENTSFRVFKSVAGATAGEILDNTAVSIAGAVTTVSGSGHLYFSLNSANSKIFSHSGVAGSATLIDTTPAANTVFSAKTVGDDFYYQYSSAFNVKKSIAGALSVEVKDSSGASFLSAVQTLNGVTKMYVYHAGGSVLVYSHSGATANATLVRSLTAANSVTVPAVVADDLYYQESATFKVFKSVLGAAGAEVTDSLGASIVASVAFVPGSSSYMYFHGNASGGNAVLYSHTGAPGIAATALNGALGVFSSAKMITAGDNLFFQGASISPSGLFESVAGAPASVVSNYSPSADDDTLCSTPAQPVASGVNLFFVANNGTNGCELWKTSGDPASTIMISDIYAGQLSSNPRSLTTLGTRVYFVAQDGTVAGSPLNTFLYYTDTPYASATKVTLTGADINPSPVYLTAVGSKLYLGASVAGVVTLFEHDTLGAAVASIKQTGGAANLTINTGTPPFIVALGSAAVVRAAPLGGAVYDIYRSDSTQPVSENPVLIKHINVSGVASSNPTFFVNAMSGGTLFFSADDGAGAQLWKTDGTTTNTAKVRNINSSPTAPASAQVSQLTMVGTSLYFTAVDGASGDGGAELYVSKSPWITAQKLTYRTGNPRVINLNSLGSNLIFTMSEDGSAANSSIYRTDGTVAGTVRIRTAGGVAAPVFNTLNFSVLNSNLYFVFQSNTTTGNQIFRTDGTVGGTGLLKALNPSPFSTAVDEVSPSDVNNFSIVGTALVFPGNSGTNGTQLWYTEYTSGSTQQISNFTPNDNVGSAPKLLGVASGAAYYVLRDVTHGRSVYKVTQP